MPNAVVLFGAAYGTLPIPTRTGYTFGGWRTGDNGTGTVVTAATSVSNAANHSLYAKWTLSTYTVTDDAAGGTVSPATKTVTYSAAYGILSTPLRSKYSTRLPAGGR